MLVTTTRHTLSVLALFLMFLGLDARPLHAETLTRPQVRKLLKARLAQAFAVDAEIQRDLMQLARVQTAIFPAVLPSSSPEQTKLAQDQATLAQIQYQISQLKSLLAALNEAYAVDAQIQMTQKQIAALRRQRRKGPLVRQQIAALKALKATLQASLAGIQAQISSLQKTITPL